GPIPEPHPRRREQGGNGELLRRQERGRPTGDGQFSDPRACCPPPSKKTRSNGARRGMTSSQSPVTTSTSANEANNWSAATASRGSISTLVSEAPPPSPDANQAVPMPAL